MQQNIFNTITSIWYNKGKNFKFIFKEVSYLKKNKFKNFAISRVEFDRFGKMKQKPSFGINRG